MDRLFGQLRSILHAPPSRHAWRRLWRLIDHAPADYAAQQLVPYAAELLDRSWPDALRAAPAPWLRAIAGGHKPVGWPLVRAMYGMLSEPIAQALSAGDHLAAITTIDVGSTYTPTPALHALLAAPSLRRLRYLETLYIVDDQLIELVIARHADTLESLRVGRWRHALPLSFALTRFPRLASLDIHPMSLDPRVTRELLTSARLPALRHLTINLAGAPDDALLREATLPRQLHSLQLYQGWDHSQTTAAAALLHALPTDRALDHLFLQGCFSVPSGLDTLLSSALPAPRRLTINGLLLTPTQLAQLGQWRGLEGVERLDLLNLPYAQTALAPLLAQPWTASLKHLTISRSFATDLAAALTTHPLPALQSLSVTDSALRGWPTSALSNNLPALTSLELRGCRLDPHTLGAIAVAPWLAQLHALRLGDGQAPPDQLDALCARLAAHPHLRSLMLKDLGAQPAHLSQLTAAPLPELRELELGAIAGLTRRDIDALGAAPWLPSLASLDLIARKSPHDAALERLNLRAALLKHGLPRLARVRY